MSREPATPDELQLLAKENGLQYTARDERNLSDIAASLETVPDEDYTSACLIVSGELHGVRVALFSHVVEPPDKHERCVHRNVARRMGGVEGLPAATGGSTSPTFLGTSLRVICSVGLAFANRPLPRAVLSPRLIRPWPIRLLTGPVDRAADDDNRQYGRVYEADGPEATAANALLTHDVRRILSKYPRWPIELAGNTVAVCTERLWPIEQYRRVLEFLPEIVRVLPTQV